MITFIVPKSCTYVLSHESNYFKIHKKLFSPFLNLTGDVFWTFNHISSFSIQVQAYFFIDFIRRDLEHPRVAHLSCSILWTAQHWKNS